MVISKRKYSRITLLVGMLVFWGATAFAAVSEQTRIIANQMASRSVSRFGCSDFEQYFQAELAPRLDTLRKSKDWNSEYLQNLIWHYSKKRYKSYNQKYEKSSEALMGLMLGYLRSGKVGSDALVEISAVSKRYGISCDCKDTTQTADAASRAAEALSQVQSLNQGTNLEVNPQTTECKTEETETSSQSLANISSDEERDAKTKNLLDIAYEGTKILRNKYRERIGVKSSTKPTKYCASFVSIALEQAGCREQGVKQEFRGHAKYLGKALEANGFRNLMSEKGVLPEGMKSLYDAPAGSVLIYDGGTYGHAEIRSNDGFVSDYFTKRARTGESGKPKGSSRRIIGIWIKPYCGAGHEI